MARSWGRTDLAGSPAKVETLGPPDVPVRVRDLAWNDFEPLVEIYWHLYDERAAGEPIGIHLFPERPSLSSEVEWFAGLYRRVLAGETIAVVAEENARAVGSCTIAPFGGRADSEMGHVGILGILVDHRHRGHGVGRALMVEALDRAKAQFEVVQLGVFATNTRARALYADLGFVPSGAIPGGVRRGEQRIDALEMVLDLRTWTRPAAANR